MRRATTRRCTRSTGSSSRCSSCSRSPTRSPSGGRPTIDGAPRGSTRPAPTSSSPVPWCWRELPTSTGSRASSSARRPCVRGCCSTPSPGYRAARCTTCATCRAGRSRALAERCDDDLAHSAHVAALALQLFDATESLHGLPADAREYLEAGALLGQRRLGDLAQQAPPAQLLRGAQQRAHGSDRHRDRDHRPDRPLPPQERPKGQSHRVRAALPRRSATGQDARRDPAGRNRARPQPRRAGAIGDGAGSSRSSGDRGRRADAARRSASSCTRPTSAPTCSRKSSDSGSRSSLRPLPERPPNRTGRWSWSRPAWWSSPRRRSRSSPMVWSWSTSRSSAGRSWSVPWWWWSTRWSSWHWGRRS